MPLEAPQWLFLGLAYTAGATVLAAAAFALGGYAFPVQPNPGGRGVSGADRRRDEVRAYLASIGERVVEDAVVRGSRPEFYLPERDVAVTFDPATYDRLRGSETYVVFCEHEMRGADLGARLPFDTPDQRRRTRRTTSRQRTRRTGRGAYGSARAWDASRRAQARDDAIRKAYRTLGLSRDASASEVRAAYREKVKDAHPDGGGSEAAFSRVREAYATAKADAD